MLRRRIAAEGRLALIISIPDAVPPDSKGIDWNDVLQMRAPYAN